MQKTDMEYFSCSKVFDARGVEIKQKEGTKNVSWDGFVGYSCWAGDEDTRTFYLNEPTNCYPFSFSFTLSEYAIDELYNDVSWWTDVQDWWTNNNYPCLNVDGYHATLDSNFSFEFSGTYVRQGNSPCLLDYLVEVE